MVALDMGGHADLMQNFCNLDFEGLRIVYSLLTVFAAYRVAGNTRKIRCARSVGLKGYTAK